MDGAYRDSNRFVEHDLASRRVKARLSLDPLVRCIALEWIERLRRRLEWIMWGQHQHAAFAWTPNEVPLGLFEWLLPPLLQDGIAIGVRWSNRARSSREPGHGSCLCAGSSVDIRIASKHVRIGDSFG
jgi:hypothetical protein